MTTYACKACGKPATVQQGQVVRSCNCAGTVIASLTAVATGKAK